MGRQKTIADLRVDDVTAYIDFSTVEAAGLLQLPVEIKVNRLVHLRPTYISPTTVTISIRQK